MFSTWIYRIATNICLNELRTGRYKYEVEFKGPDEHDDSMQYDPVDERTKVKTDEQMAAAEQQRQVQHALKNSRKNRGLLLF